MSIWRYPAVRPPTSAEPFELENCPFCRAAMHQFDTIEPDKDEELLRTEPIAEVTQRLRLCKRCGWWSLAQVEESYCFLEDIDIGIAQLGATFGSAASLVELDLSDIRLPISEVRDFLTARYERRFDLHPRLFEETVCSVFSNLGWSASATAYTGDGGIDVILEDGNGKRVGVQVKRWKNRVSVEQIRALTGALVLGDFTEGVFVTTSGYQSGASTTANRASERGFPIELVDAPRFYEMLSISKRDHWDPAQIAQEIAGKRLDLVEIYYQTECNRPSHRLRPVVDAHPDPDAEQLVDLFNRSPRMSKPLSELGTKEGDFSLYISRTTPHTD